MKQSSNISAPKVGIQKESHPSQLKNTEYLFMLNGNTESQVGEGFTVVNEPSNNLAVTFPTGYKVIHYKKDLLNNKTYFFLTHPTTKKSSIGYVSDTIIKTYNEDIYTECTDCSKNHNELSEALENTVQTPSHTYIEIVNDNCLAVGEGFNFDINFPIKFSELKQEKGETNIYWNDYKNKPRWMCVSNTDYLFTQEIPCGDDVTVSCIQIHKLLQFPEHSRLEIQAEAIQTGGNIKMGTYEFYATYSNLFGDEATNYSTPTNPISIFDENNNILDQTELDSFTNYSIRLKVNNLDTNYKYYKVVCVESNNVERTKSAFIVGIYPTTDDTVLFTSSGSTNDDSIATGNSSIKRRVDLYELSRVRPNYTKARGDVASGGRKFMWGLETKPELNLQPVVNLFSPLLKWQSSVAKEGLYKSAVATSKFKGWMRNEVQPFAIRFTFKDGGYTSNFPMVARPSVGDEKSTIIEGDLNYDSLLENTPNCASSERNKKWQIYNTATQDNICESYTVGGTEVGETVERSCLIEAIATIPTDTITIVTEDYTNLKQYIEDNPDVVIPEITPYIEDTYPDHCLPYFGVTTTSGVLVQGATYLINDLQAGDNFTNVGFVAEGINFVATGTTPTSWVNGTEVTKTTCDTATLVDSYNEIGIVDNEVLNYIEKDPALYQKSIPPVFCNNLKTYTTGGSIGDFIRDTTFETNYMPCGETVYFRNFTAQNEDPLYASSIPNNNIPSQSGFSLFHNYYGDEVLANLITTKNALAGTNFQNKLHKGALYFQVSKLGRDKIIFEITKNSACENLDNIAQVNEVRYTFYSSASETALLGGAIVDTTLGTLIEVDVTLFPNIFFVAIDNPIVTETRCSDMATIYRTAPSCACFSVYTRDIEYSSLEVTWDSITIDKTEVYSSTCTFLIPKVDECEPVPYASGKFAYWESTETYPDNKELYDSSNLIIAPSDLNTLSAEDKASFIDYFTNGTGINGKYNLTADTNLTCSPIRHYKFPDNNVSPFMADSNVTAFSDALIFPLGVALDSAVVRTMLEVAYKNGLITQVELDNIEGYEVLKGDNSIHKSVIANGLGYDMYKYTQKGKDYHYANYPHNDLGDDLLHYKSDADKTLIQHPFAGTKNNKFSFISPDLFLNRIAIPTEAVLSGYQVGNSRGQFTDVEEHPKWAILGDKARKTALLLAELEATLELAVKVAESVEAFRVSGGVVVSFNPGAFLAIASATAALAAVPMSIGKYRYEWLKIFDELGTAYNFADYHVSHGYHNSFIKNNSDANYIRGLSLRKYLRDGRFAFRDESNGDKLFVNNFQREHSIFLSTGQHFFNYDSEYYNYDNNKISTESSSRTTLGKNSEQNEAGIEYERNVGSPYITLKNYIPDQFGNIDSIKWLTTNYTAKLNDNTICKTIFGGNVCLSRFTWKRKLPIFSKNIVGTPDILPFNYGDYKNIGSPVYYCNYKEDGEYNGLAIPFPDIKSNFNFDANATNNRFYIRPPAKMHLFYYGITDFIVESEINCNFRYAGKPLKEQFFPQVGDMVDWTQEKNVSIREPNTIFYNNTYSQQVSNTPYTLLDSSYNKELWLKRSKQDSAVVYSEIDNNENDLTDPWLTYKPLNWYEFPTKYGKLIQLRGIESDTLLGRFENQQVIFNSLDKLNTDGNRVTIELGNAGIFAKRPQEFQTTDLGYSGTQHSEMVSTPYGHFSVDAKRGEIFQQAGEKLESITNKPTSGLKQWFKEQLPFKILKSFPQVNIDNKFKSIGISMGWDARMERLFITKKDYKVINNTCLKYTEDLGFYTDCGATTTSCPDGYTYNTLTASCELITSSSVCGVGFTYNTLTGLCQKPLLDCSEGLDIVFILDGTGSQQTSIDNIKNAITTDIVPAIVANFGVDYRLGLTVIKDRRATGQALFDILVPMVIANEATFLTQINTIVASSGGGEAEPSDMALASVLNNTPAIDQDGTSLGGLTTGVFRTGAAKAIVLVTDNPPSGLNDNYEFADWTNANNLALQASLADIQIFSYLTSPTQPAVVAPPSLPSVTYIMQNYATVTGGTYYFTPIGVGISDGVVDAIVSGINCLETETPICLEGCVQDDALCVCTDVQPPIVEQVKTFIDFDNTTYFQPAHWTISYKPTEEKWNSYFSITPDYYINHNQHFQTGNNYGIDKGKMWSHLMGNTSFGVFNGRREPFIIEYPIVDENANKLLESISLEVEGRRWINEYDFSVNKSAGFNKVLIYSNTNNSGLLNLKEQKSYSDSRNYPKTNNDNTQDILYTALEGKHTFNYFYNRVKNQDSNIPNFLWDNVMVNKVVNTQAVSFTGKKILERMKGTTFTVRLINDSDSRHQIVLNKAVNSNTLYE